jgi:antagonist of KipI
MRSLAVHRAGLLTTIQDEGRWGYQASGVPVSGPMDPWSHRLANVLVGNPRGTATLEVTGVGPSFSFTSEATVAIAGARFHGELDGAPWTSPVVLQAPAGARIVFGERLAGLRAYVAVSGGLDVPRVLGSRATDVRSGLGGLNGRPLRDGDSVPLGAPPLQRTTSRIPGGADWMLATGTARLRLIRGPDEGPNAAAALDALTSITFTVSQRCDRMGYHLEGGFVPIDAEPRLSAPVATGVVQVPPSGQPVLLMADRQTTGGYAPIGAVIAADLPVAGQLGPGDSVCFAPCDIATALRQLVAREQVLLAVERS